MTTHEAVSQDQDNYAKKIVIGIMWTALVVAPLLLGGLAVFFVIRAFTSGFPAGLRSFAAVILPLMVLTFVVAPKIGKEHAAEAVRGRIPEHPLWLATATMTAVGAVMMQLLTISTSIPIVELILSAGFSFILYLWADDRDRAAPYCLGLVIGALGYVIILGVPHV
ncbi:hypothetical protein AMES_7261 [Amycolatopsis mediterranei S699]|uniref:Uncharacterized protein n=2 Tax=Amycolatopsis mediterranei TaxID=33910 RepID=A0A0H3DEF4_AMYMU|nr:hypothetical protein [Amycolatopsis mediterranei]ADJ49086.1 hypothetical protein AMED_7372 [Amycolatopsis mediterranei U32]AEK46047.1 hypothetical protein RAM_37900 [Amycolatopsis mediterranei S699]AFO80794.1 hypothetical protein AMES_7261 [Amycolatopsis mediterranei S699]AGT87922.1 hypothetical protein B737_7261 [Amycolatopsis mediterranei RB]KDO04067.1 hypothetical protein DV26_46130 [Amycolatopsis mediterranei]